MTHTYAIDIKVRGYHLDVFGHVNNARYLEFMEEARWAAVERTVDLIDLVGKGYAFTVVKISINYRRPAFLNEMLRIETRLAEIGRRSAVIHQRVTLKGTETIVADADITFVMVNTRTRKAAPLEGEVLAVLEAMRDYNGGE